MKNLFLPFLCATFIASATAADTKSVNLTEMGVGLCVARTRVPAPATASDREFVSDSCSRPGVSGGGRWPGR